MKIQKQAEQLWDNHLKAHALLNRIGLEDELDITKELALYLIANPGSHLEAIKKAEYFRTKSNSTIKRAAETLFKKGYVKHTKCSLDSRRKLLFFKNVD